MKIIRIILFLSLLFLSSCFNTTNPEDVNNAKKDLGVIKVEKNKEITEEKKEEEKVLDKEIIVAEENIEIEFLTEKKFIELNELNYEDFVKGEAEISGVTLDKIDKIEVTFSNKFSEFPDDFFVLKQFKPGDKTFAYRAHTTYRVLDFGINEYVFTAYVGENVSKIKVTVDVQKENKEKVTEEKIKFEDVETDLRLPSGSEFGHPISLGGNSYTYSDISGLEIKKDSFSPNTSCDNITAFLTKKLDSWFYWNTCRNILSVKQGEETKGISVYVIKLEGEEYFYEKHYLDFNHQLYGSYEIEKGKNVDKDNISKKNDELKEKNEDIIKIEMVDNLFKQIVK